MREGVFIYSAELEKYPYPEDHPFNINRAKRTHEILSSMGLLSGSGKRKVSPEPADKVTLEKFHSADYLQALKTASEGHLTTEALNMGIGTPDCPVFTGLYDYAILATGGTLLAANLILSGSADVVFNPSGGYHHAGPESASGFCYINDVALACMVLADEGRKVLYLDVDVHHGDGVANAFYDRCDVMTLSLHENPVALFPGTGFADEIGTGKGKGYCVNIPLPIGTYDQMYMKAFNSIAMPLIGSYDPDVIVFELGADALMGDPLAHLCLTNNTYADIIKLLLSFDKPILATGGGGYNVENTARAWALAWSVLCSESDEHDMNIGAGGVMLESTDWEGGLRDREFVIRNQQMEAVLPEIENTIETIKAKVFPIHGL
jgi:acetoin utilization protein AcuC